MQKKFLLIKMVLLLFVCVNSMAQDLKPSASISAKQARMLATEQLPSVLQWMEPEDMELYGFSMKDDFSRIRVGRPFYLSTMDDVKLYAEKKATPDIRSMILPLILDNSVRCFIYISLEDGKWKAVGLGSRNLAVKGGEIFNKTDNVPSLLVSIDQLNEEFIVENSGGVNRYTPVFRINKDLSQKSYSFNEMLSLHAAALKNPNN